MLKENLKYIFDQFQHQSEFDSYVELASGHINDTYLIKTKEKPYYVLQRINHGVFQDIPGLINNKVSISRHLQKKFAHLPKSEIKRRVLSFMVTLDGSLYCQGQDREYWNMSVFVDNSVTFETVLEEEIAYEGGKLFGDFLNFTSDFDASKLVEVIPNFHDMSFRYMQFEEALNNASKERLDIAHDYISLVESSRKEMHILQGLKESGVIKTRVTHNDTKISNALFDLNNKSLCVIDTDTVMPGIIHYDFGDAIRTICNTSAEDEKNLNLVKFNIIFYKAYLKGFIEKIGSSLSPIEFENLPLGAKTIIFIMGLRFLTDYLNNDIYYKAEYSEHNLDRAKNQFKLMEDFSEQYEEIKQITEAFSPIK
jgi:hypothetical protein